MGHPTHADAYVTSRYRPRSAFIRPGLNALFETVTGCLTSKDDANAMPDWLQWKTSRFFRPENAPLPPGPARSRLISGGQQFVVPGIPDQRGIVQSRRDGTTVAACRTRDCVVGAAGLPVGRIRSRHRFIPTSRICAQTLRLGEVDSELHFQANHAVQTDPLGQNDLVRRVDQR